MVTASSPRPNYKDLQPIDFEFANVPPRGPEFGSWLDLLAPDQQDHARRALARELAPDKRRQEEKNNNPVQPLLDAVEACGTTWVNGTCQEGHAFQKQTLCGRDWCPECGKRDSSAHLRRSDRTMHLVEQLGQQGLGYFVTALQDKDRNQFRSAAALREAAQKAVEVFRDAGKPICPHCGRPGKQRADGGDWICPTSPKRHGIIGPADIGQALFPRGIERWHFYGEPSCPVPHCGRPGRWAKTLGEWRCGKHGVFRVEDVRDQKYNPHLNSLVDAAWIDPETLLALQEALSRAILGKWETVIDPKTGRRQIVEGVILNYSFVPAIADPKAHGPKEEKLVETHGMEAVRQYRVARYLHRAKYIQHPNFLRLDWDPDLAVDLINFRNTRYWGTWSQENVWAREETPEGEDMAALSALGENRCPIDGSRVSWQSPIVRARVDDPNWTDLGGGYRMRKLGDQEQRHRPT